MGLPLLTGTVTVTGTPEVGQTLTANTTSLGGSGTISYQWKRSAASDGTYTNIASATSATYTLQTADNGKYITVTVTRAYNSGSVTGGPTSRVPFIVDSGNWDDVFASIRESSETLFTIIVTADLSLSPQDLTDPDYAGKTIVLKGDTSSRTVGLASVGSLFTVGEDLSLELENITVQGRTDNNAPLIKVDTGGLLTVKTGGTVTGNTNAITSYTGNYGGGIYVDAGGTLVLDGGTISGNTVSGPRDAGGAGINVLGTFIMYGGNITGNHATNTADAYGAGGAGVRVDGNGTFTMTDGTISGNIAHCTGYASGGGVCIAGDGTFIMEDGLITDNTVSSSSTGWDQRGGGLCYYYSAFTGPGDGSITGNWSIKGNKQPETNEIYSGPP